MKILNTDQIRALDAQTIKKEPISSIDLMERASQTFVDWFVDQFPKWKNQICIICGPGNNGGDGLAIARLLFEKDYLIMVLICEISDHFSDDFLINLERIKKLESLPIEQLNLEDKHPSFETGTMIIDAIFGSGLNRSISGKLGEYITYLNEQNVLRIAVDVPSGLFSERHSNGVVFNANYTFSFEFPKLSFVFPENQNHVGEWFFQSINLDTQFIQEAKTTNYFIDNQSVKAILKNRKKYDHKGTFGHAVIVCGSYGKVGAAILAGKACLRSGAGLVTIHSPKCAYNILQISFPEAMVSIDDHEFCISNVAEISSYKSIGIGCGIGTDELTQKALNKLLDTINKQSKKKKEINPLLVLDADALNILSENKNWLKKLPKGSILTPHPKEFERLFGKFENDFQRNEHQRKIAQKFGIYLVLKGANTSIACPDGNCYFNSTGNPGMATGGSGDVLTGILTGFLAQGYSAFQACILGIYLHGLAGDIASESTQQEALLSSDIINHMGQAFKAIRKK